MCHDGTSHGALASDDIRFVADTMTALAGWFGYQKGLS